MGLLLEKRKADVEKHLGKYPSKLSAVMPLLYIAQEEYGYVTEDAIQEVAEIVDVDPTHVRGIIGFYMMYYDRPIGKNHIYVCTDLPCALRGAEELSGHICDHLGVKPHEVTEDGLFSVENVMCIGACHRAPVMQVNFRFHEDMTGESAVALIEKIRREYEASKPYSDD